MACFIRSVDDAWINLDLVSRLEPRTVPGRRPTYHVYDARGEATGKEVDQVEVDDAILTGEYVGSR